MSEVENPVQELWQTQPVEGIRISAKEIHRRAGKFERKIRWRNVREYVASLVAVGLFVCFFVTTQDVLSRVTFVLFIGAMFWIVISLHWKGSAKKIPESVDTVTGLRAYRAELERQYRVVRGVWWWYLAPLVPGFAVYTVGYAIRSPHPWAWVILVLMDAIVAGMFYVVWRINVRAARCLMKMIEELKGVE